jgi:glycosyltransferase involved in cell wall biosynthesis
MRILNLIQCANLGGMEQASLRLMRGLKERGEELHLLSLNPIGKLGPLLEQAKIPHEGLPYLGKGGWRSYGLLKRRLAEIEADGLIMTGHNLLAMTALGDICRGHRILGINFHHSGVKTQWQWQLIYRLACSRFDAITFPCDFIRKEAEAIYPPVARLGHTVRYPLEMPQLPTPAEKVAARQLLGLPQGSPVVGNAGWLIPRKRFDVFLRTARGILDKSPDTLFVIAGDGPERERLQKLAQELGIDGSVRWLGWQEDMPKFYQAIDVLLFNSDWDAMGLTPLEATSYGVPAVCSVLNGGLGEVFDSDRVGILLSTHDTNVLAGRVLDLLNRPAEAARIGLAGRERVELVSRPAPIAEWHARTLSGAVPTPVLHRVGLENKTGSTAILFHRVGPYHFARARAAGKLLETTLIEIFGGDEVYDWAPVHGADGFKRVTLFEKHPQPSCDIERSVRNTLNKIKPATVAIPGWSDAVAFSALKWCLKHRVPAIVMSESTEWDEQRTFWREGIKRRLLKLCSSGLVGGRPHASYLVNLGMAQEKVFQGYDAVDNEYFAGRAAAVRAEEESLRKKYRLPGKYFLVSARFVDKKNLFNVVKAYARYRQLIERTTGVEPATAPWDLVVLGDGPLKAGLRESVNELGLEKFISLPGFKQYDELPIFYGLAHAFIHASTTEQWGLVVNEAMASGLPVLVSNRCGCAQDLALDGANGFTFDPNNVEEMAQLMMRMGSLPAATLEAMGRESQKIVADWSPERFGQGMARAVETALATTAPKPTFFDRLLLELLLRKQMR